MYQAPHAACIAACEACARACSHCATACLGEQDVQALVRCIALDIDCAEICRLAAAAMARDSEFAASICRTCAEICDACGNACGMHSMQHCQDCSIACRACARECRAMAQAHAQRPAAEALVPAR